MASHNLRVGSINQTTRRPNDASCTNNLPWVRSPSHNSLTANTSTIRRFTNAELQQRCRVRLCYHCDKPYTTNHDCKWLFFIELEQDIEDTLETKFEAINEVKPPAISLHALAGVPTPQTMHVCTKVAGNSITILIDSGLTHNFLHDQLAQKLGISIEPTLSMSIKLTNGEKLQGKGFCKQAEITLKTSHLRLILCSYRSKVAMPN